MVRCAIEGCTNYQGKKDGEKCVRFFCFPKNAKLSQEWLRVCGRGIKLNINIARICSEHFGKDDWKLQHILLNVPEHKRKLKVGAIPSKNLPRAQGPTKRDERNKKREQKELVEQAISTYNRKYVMEISSHFNEPEVDAPKIAREPGRMKIPEPDDPLAAPGPEAESLTKENRLLKLQLKRLMKRLHQAETAISSMEHIFTEGQIKRVRNPNKKYKWSYEDISYSASLYSAGPSAYAQLIKSNYPLPTPVALRKWAATLKLKPGILTNIVKLLSELKYEEVDRLCILSFHEISLKAASHEDPSDNEPAHKSAQAFIVRGLMSDWKQIIHYSYDCPEARVVLKEIIHTLKSINFTVVAVVSGVGHLKLPLWVEMEVDMNRPYAKVIEEEKVFFFGNVPHLIKNFRNCFVETGLMVNDKCVNVDPLKELLDKPDLELSYKFTEAHISPKKITRQNVQLAWQLLTLPVANALRKYVSMGKIYSQNAIECSDLIQLFSDWLDVFNAKCTTETEAESQLQGSLAYGLELQEQNNAISLMNKLIKNISRSKYKTLLPFQKGILLNNASLMQLLEYLQQKYNIGYVVTNRFNQDDLEESLRIRRANTGLGGQPTALEFKYRINSGVLSSLNVTKT